MAKKTKSRPHLQQTPMTESDMVLLTALARHYGMTNAGVLRWVLYTHLDSRPGVKAAVMADSTLTEDQMLEFKTLAARTQVSKIKTGDSK